MLDGFKEQLRLAKALLIQFWKNGAERGEQLKKKHKSYLKGKENGEGKS